MNDDKDMLRIENLRTGYDGKLVLQGLDLSLQRGKPAA
jgi:ABC-type cobalamin/Fe3+-siderophores transport system ATPase subunit